MSNPKKLNLCKMEATSRRISLICRCLIESAKKIVLKRGVLTTVKLWYRYFGHVAKCQGLDCGSTTYSVRNHKSCIMLSDLDYRVGQLIIDFYHQFPKVNLMVIALIDILRQVQFIQINAGPVGQRIPLGYCQHILLLAYRDGRKAVIRRYIDADTDINLAFKETFPWSCIPKVFCGVISLRRLSTNVDLSSTPFFKPAQLLRL